MPRGQPRKKVKTRPTMCNQHDGASIDYPPSEYRNHFACPFVKRNSDRYKNVNNSCTQRWGFRNIGSLNEHIWRMHSLQFGCVRCKKRFTQYNKKNIEQAKRDHQCVARMLTSDDSEWMDEEQEILFSNWNEEGNLQESGPEKWARIYRCIFAIKQTQNVPSPFYDYLIPKYLSLLPLRGLPEAPASEVDTAPSLIKELATPTQAVDNTNALSALERTPFDPAMLEHNGDQYDCGFEFSVYRGTDSGYFSGRNAVEEVLPDISFLQGLSSIPLSVPSPKSVVNGPNVFLGIGQLFPPGSDEHDADWGDEDE